MEQSPTTSIKNDEIAPARNSQESGHTRKTVLADLSQKKSNAATWTTKQPRDTDMLACGCAQTRVSRSTKVSYLLLPRDVVRMEECRFISWFFFRFSLHPHQRVLPGLVEHLQGIAAQLRVQQVSLANSCACTSLILKNAKIM